MPKLLGLLLLLALGCQPQVQENEPVAAPGAHAADANAHAADANPGATAQVPPSGAGFVPAANDPAPPASPAVAGEQTADPAANAKKQADAMSLAMAKGDYETIVDLTYHTVFRELGGKQEAVEITATFMKEMAERGYILTACSAGEPSELFREAENTFVVVPTKTEMNAPVGKVVADSYLLGISPNGGKTWTFVDGSGLATQEARDQVLPKLPAGLKLPEPKTPMILIQN